MTGKLRHKVAAYMSSAVLSMWALGGLQAQTPPAADRIQAVIPELRSARQAHEVDLALRDLAGVRMSRTDYNTRNLLMEVAANGTITREQVQALLLPFELTLSCYTREALTSHTYAPLDPRSCEQTPLVR